MRYRVSMMRRLLMVFTSLLALPAAGFAQTSVPASRSATQPTTRPVGRTGGTADWSIFRGGPTLTGVADGTIPDQPAFRWKFKTGEAVKSSPVVAGGVVYVGSDDGRLYALDLATGRKLWDFIAGDYVQAPPFVRDGLVYVGTYAGVMHCLTARSGVLIWKRATGGQILGSASAGVAKGTDGVERPLVVFGSYDYKLYCLDSRNGEVVWDYKTENYANGTPSMEHGRAIYGGCDGFLYVFSLADGKDQMKIDLGSYVGASVAAVGEEAYVGTYGGAFVRVDIKAGKVAWKQQKEETCSFMSSPAVGDDRIVVGSRDEKLYCFARKDGSTLWTFQAEGAIDSSPVICGGKVVFGCDDGRLYIVRLADGKKLDSVLLGQGITSSPAVSNGMIVIGCDDGYVYAYGPEPGKAER